MALLATPGGLPPPICPHPEDGDPRLGHKGLGTDLTTQASGSVLRGTKLAAERMYVNTWIWVGKCLVTDVAALWGCGSPLPLHFLY